MGKDKDKSERSSKNKTAQEQKTGSEKTGKALQRATYVVQRRDREQTIKMEKNNGTSGTS